MNIKAVFCLIFMAITVSALASNKKNIVVKDSVKYDVSVPKSTLSEVSYGIHKRQVLDFWKANSETPTPLVFVIHGGGWNGGSKELLHKFVDINKLLESGISVVAINYRLIKHADKSDSLSPVKAPLFDAARALQFVRSKASEWNINKTKIAAAGGSAGACSSLWLAYHNDLAEPNSEDVIARESTRLFCAAVTRAQTTLDPKLIRDWIPNCKYGGHAFGKKGFEEYLKDREEILPLINEYSPYSLVDGEDPEVYLFYTKPPKLGETRKDPVHSSNFGVMLKEKCDAVGIDCEVMYPEAVGVKHQTTTSYLIAKFKKD